jgi:hypothetical protein
VATIFELNIWEPIQLKLGDQLLGVLRTYETDQPFVHCDFEPTPAFETVRDYFDKARAEFRTKNLAGWQEKQKEIESLGLRLLSLDGKIEVDKFLLHIQGNKAQFRDWT